MIDQATALRNLKHQATALDSIVFNAEAGPHPVSKPSTSIVVTSGKGGVGKTHFSVSMAIALSRLKKKVVVFDADMGLANINIVLGINPEWHLIHVMKGKRKLKDIIIPGPEGLRIIPASSGVESLANMDAAQLNEIVYELKGIENETDFLILDTGAGISKTVMQFAVSADKVIVMTTPEPTAFTDAYGTIKCILNRNKNAGIGLLVNFCRTEEEGKEVYNKMKMMVLQFLKKHISYLGQLPFEPNFHLITRKQKTIMTEAPNAIYSRAVNAIGRNLAGKSVTLHGKGKGFFARMIEFLKNVDSGY